MVIAPVDQRDFDVGSLECTGCRDARKAAADDQNTLRPHSRRRGERPVLWERFGQNCRHWCHLRVPEVNRCRDPILDTAADRAILERRCDT
jgi:hypothetical protein